jgi:NAD(P)-dependent dehydrogenase (short-subunit alcohol dehydrogenase family)
MQAWQDCFDVLLTGVLNTVEATYPYLIEQGSGGSIVITSSMAGVRPMMRTLGGHTLGLLGYSAAKAALVNLMENYASILAFHKIRVNTVHPTGVNTPMILNDMCADRFATASEEDLKALVNAIPVDAVEAEDVANAVAWLCSDASRYFTGSSMRIDAGASLR